jgi:hypothetical protein
MTSVALFNAVIWIGALATLGAVLTGRFSLVPWTLFALAGVWHIGSRLQHARTTNNLDCYIVYLLLDDEIRAKQKATFIDWIRETPAKDAADLSTRAILAIDRVAKALAAGDPSRPGTSSLMGAHAMLWQVKTRSVDQ